MTYRDDNGVSANAHIAELEAENTSLRAALANSDQPCPYCTLPAKEWAKCKSGFPGCARADDAMGCPELGASLQVAELEAEVERLATDLRDERAEVGRLEQGMADWREAGLEQVRQKDVAEAKVAELEAELEECTIKIVNDAKNLAVFRVRAESAEARLAAALEALGKAAQAAYDEVLPDCGQVMAQAAFHAVKSVTRQALAQAAPAPEEKGDD